MQKFKKITQEKAKTIFGFSNREELRAFLMERYWNDEEKREDLLRFTEKPEFQIKISISDDLEWYGQGSDGGRVGHVENVSLEYKQKIFYIVDHEDQPINQSYFRHNVDDDDIATLPGDSTCWQESPFSFEGIKADIEEQLKTATAEQLITIKKYIEIEEESYAG